MSQIFFPNACVAADDLSVNVVQSSLVFAQPLTKNSKNTKWYQACLFARQSNLAKMSSEYVSYPRDCHEIVVRLVFPFQFPSRYQAQDYADDCDRSQY